MTPGKYERGSSAELENQHPQAQRTTSERATSERTASNPHDRGLNSRVTRALRIRAHVTLKLSDLQPKRGAHANNRGPGYPRRSTWSRVVTAIVMTSLVVAAASYYQALVYPGHASVLTRTVDWVRDNGGSPLIDAGENWWYTSAPPESGSTSVPSSGWVSALQPDRSRATQRYRPPKPSPASLISEAMGVPEGQWISGPVVATGLPAMSVTYVHPDPTDPEVLVGIARFDQNRVRAQLIPGTTQPDRHYWPERGQVPRDQRAGLVATFNSGFKMADTPGGFYADGQLARPLSDGAAALVIDRAGRVSVDQWGRDRNFGPDIAAIRQNLSLIVDHGVPVVGLDTNRDQRWGSAKNQWQHTWRSAVGVARDDTLFYIAGDGLTLTTLARALAHTGVLRGMELDMHAEHVNLFAYRHEPGAAAPTPIPLLGTMPTPWDRYLYPDQRDFITLTLR